MLLWGYIIIGAVIAAAFYWRGQRRFRLHLLDWLLEHPTMHPQEFFHAYYRGLLPWGRRLDASPRCLDVYQLDFRRGKAPKRRVLPVLHGACSTMFLAGLLLQASRTARFAERMPHLMNTLMGLWGRRLLDLCHLHVQFEGEAQLHQLNGPVIVCGNHQSLLDFVVAPAVLSLINPQQRALFSLRYMLARDHFLENIFLHRILRIGQAAQVGGMIFVHRKGDAAQRRAAIGDAAHELCDRQVDVAMYPQGTRAPLRPRDGGLCEPGYFTAGGPRRLQQFGRHVKTGAARIALAVAERAGAAMCLPLAVHGAGQVIPKGKVSVRSESTIVLRIGEPVSVRADESVDDIHERIDKALQGAVDIAVQLQEALDQCGSEYGTAFAEWTGDVQLLYATTDCLLQLRAAERAKLMEQWLRAAQANDELAMRDVYISVIETWNTQTA